jgi:hypothetical protein
MAQGQKRNQPLVLQASQGLERLKYETASEIGVNYDQFGGYGGDIPSRLNGAVGGHMVRKMIAAAEQSLINQASASVSAGFRQGLTGGSVAGGFVTNPLTIQSKNNPALSPADK